MHTSEFEFKNQKVILPFYPFCLYLVGTLDEVPNFSATVLSEDSATFTWDEPYTFIGVPILWYETVIEFSSAKDKDICLTSNQTTYMTQLMVANPFNNGFCTFINISIFAKNMAGLGAPATAFVHFREGKFYDLNFRTCRCNI